MTDKSTEQDTENRNRPTQIWTSDFWQRYKGKALKKGVFLTNGTELNGKQKKNFIQYLAPKKVIQNGS